MWRDYTFPKGKGPKMKLTARLELELSHFQAAVLYFSY